MYALEHTISLVREVMRVICGSIPQPLNTNLSHDARVQMPEGLCQVLPNVGDHEQEERNA